MWPAVVVWSNSWCGGGRAGGQQESCGRGGVVQAAPQHGQGQASVQLLRPRLVAFLETDQTVVIKALRLRSPLV